MYNENYKTLLKLKKIQRWKNILCLSVLPIKIPTMFLAEIEKYIQKLIWNLKGLQTAKWSWRKTKLEISTYCEATLIKIVWYRHKDRHINQWTRTESRNKPLLTWSNDFWKESQDHSIGKGLFSTNGLGKTGYPHAKKNKVGPLANTTYKNQLKMDQKPKCKS